MEVKLLDNSLLIQTIYNSITEFHYVHNGFKDAKMIVMHFMQAYKLLQIRPPDFSTPGMIEIQPNGRFKVFGLEVIRTSDIDEDVLIFA